MTGQYVSGTEYDGMGERIKNASYHWSLTHIHRVIAVEMVNIVPVFILYDIFPFSIKKIMVI